MLSVRLYWRTWNRQIAESRPFLHLDSPGGEVTWANQTKTHPGDKPTTSWPSDFYVVDDYRLKIPDDTPPVLATLRVGLTDDQKKLTSLAGGEDTATLEHIRVTNVTRCPPQQCPATRISIDLEKKSNWSGIALRSRANPLLLQ